MGTATFKIKTLPEVVGSSLVVVVTVAAASTGDENERERGRESGRWIYQETAATQIMCIRERKKIFEEKEKPPTATDHRANGWKRSRALRACWHGSIGS